jgi:hypothetical protein
MFGLSNSLRVIPEGDPDHPVWLASPRMTYLGPDLDYNANPVHGILKYTDKKLPTFNLTGVALIYNLHSAESVEKIAMRFKDSGLVALLTVIRAFSSSPGSGNWIRDGTRPHQPFPVFEISMTQNKSLEKWFNNQTDGVVNVVFYDEPNPWDTSYRIGVPIVSYWILLFNCLLCIIACYKLTITILVHGVQLSIPQAVFFLNLLGAFLRVILTAIDPFGVWGTTSFLFTQFMFSISLPATFGSCLLISLYWDEMIRKTAGSKGTLFVQKAKFPFFVFIFFMYCFEIVVASLRGLYYQVVVLTWIDGAMYVITILGVAIFFVVTRIRMQKIFNQINKTLKSGRGQKLALATHHFIGIIVSMAIWVFMLILSAANILWTPIGFPIAWGIYFTSLTLVGLFQVLMIRAPQRPWKWIFCGLCVQDPDELIESSLDTRDGTSKSYRTSLTTSINP